MPEPTVLEEGREGGIERPTAAIAAVIRQQRAPAAMQGDLAAYLRAQGVEGDDLEAMLVVGAERMLVYRQLVHNRLRNTTIDFLGRTVARLGFPRLRRDFEAFVEQHAPRSPYLRDVPTEFVEWVIPRWVDDPEVPGYLPDLARHELLDFDVRNDPLGGEPATALPLALDRALRFDGTARLVCYGYAVHRLPKSKKDRSEPDAEPTRLLVYRDREHQPRYLALTPFAAEVVRELLDEQKAVQPALLAAAAALGEPLDDDKLGSAALLLADLAERGVCLGAEPDAG
jgi:hypothetical protein